MASLNKLFTIYFFFFNLTTELRTFSAILCYNCNKTSFNLFNFCFRFPSRRALTPHVNTHDPEKTNICHICGLISKNSSSLKAHIKNQHSEHPNPDKLMVKCSICLLWLRGPKGLQAHTKNRHLNNLEKHQCSLCEHVSTSANALRTHFRRNHIAQKIHKCDLCEKAFKTRIQLKVSVLTV